MATFQLWVCCFHNKWDPGDSPLGQSVPCPAPAALHHVMPSALLRVRLVKFLQEKKGKAFILQGQHHVQILCITGKMISQDITMTYFTF